MFTYILNKQSVLCCVVCSLALAGCTSVIRGKTSGWGFRAETLNVEVVSQGITIHRGSLLQKRQDLLVANVKIKNAGPHIIMILRQNIALVTKGGTKFIPLDKPQLDAFTKRSYFGSFLGPGISLGNETQPLAFRERITIGPDKEEAVDLFYDVGDDYELAQQGEVLILVSRITTVDSTEYRLEPETESTKKEP